MESKIFKSPLIKTSGRRISSSSISSSGSKGDVISVLTETNRILVEIQKQLSLDFAMRAAEEKKEKRDNKISESRKRFKKEESVLEKTSKKIRKSVGKASKTIVSPAVNIFDKILEFVGLLGAGIAVNAAFKWFEDEENRKKLVKFFNILKENWRLVARILGTLVAGGVILKAAGAITTIAAVIKILAAPVLLKFLAIAGTVAFGIWIAEQIKNFSAGGKQYRELYEENNEKLNEAGVGQPSSPLSKSAPLLTPNPKGGYFQMVMKGMDQNTGQFGNLTTTSINPQTNKLYATEAQLKAFSSWKTEKLRIDQLAKEGNVPEGRALGGPVSAGIPYLVGERGPEIFAPNVDGSIINNMRTEKIYQMISSDIEGDIDFIELPPITNKIPPPNVPSLEQATDVPMISSTNSADPYLQVSPKLYGVMV